MPDRECSGLFAIVGGPDTSSETLDILTRYVRSLGGIPLILKKERPGYLYNSFLLVYLEQGDLGVKTGRAFYVSPNPDYEKPGFLNGR
jgi:3-hydroxyacyl-CoA dehydrogenase